MTKKQLISEVIENSFEQLLKESPEYRSLFDRILISSQKADHPAFDRITEAIPGHLHPARDFDSHKIRSVISYSISFTALCRVTPDGAHSSREWAQATMLFRQISNKINEQIARYYSENTFITMFGNPRYDREVSRERISSNWSERHIAWACGLGSFGRHHSLITQNGSCHRLCSLITDMELICEETKVQKINRNCLHYQGHQCDACLKNCPVSAIQPKSKDLWMCNLHEDNTCGAFNEDQYNLAVPTCGLCMINTPCTSRAPVK